MSPESNPQNGESNENRRVNRRRVLQGLTASSGVLLAGCGGNQPAKTGGTATDTGGNGGGAGMGPKVETVRIAYPNDYLTSKQEPQVPIVGEALEALGIQWEGKPGGVSKIVGDGLRDKRTHEIAFWIYTPTPDRLDPRELLFRQTIDGAGGACNGSFNSYTSCEYSVAALKSDTASTQQKRQEYVTDAFVTSSKDAAIIGGLNNPRFGAANTDKTNVQKVGKGGIALTNPYFILNSTPKDGDTLNINAQPPMAVKNPYQTTVPPVRITWFHYVNSPLLEFDHNLNLQTALAANWSSSNKSQKFTFELEPDAKFHNGDKVTAEDVKFTYEHLYAHPDVYPKAREIPIDTIETPDDETVVFNFSRPYPPFPIADVRRWGIFHKKSFVESGKAENPANVQLEEFIGSGPWQVNQLREGQYLSLTPSGTHPKHDPKHNLILQVFQGSQAAFQAFSQNQLHIFKSIPPNFYRRLADQQNARREAMKAWTNILILPQHSFPPFRYKELRMALGMALNRQKLNQVAFNGEAEMQFHGAPLSNSHPFFKQDKVPTYTDSPTGDVKGAKALLKKNGYSWDNNGNLRYPASRTPQPRWPKGESPKASNYPCLASQCELTDPDGG